MKLCKLTWIHPKGEDGANLAAVSDVHLGNRYHDEKPFNRNIDYLEEHKEYTVVTLGDLIECSSKHTLGLEDQVMEISDQIELICKRFEKIASEGRLIGMIRGNHEKRAIIHSGIDVTRTIAKYLEVPYFGPAQAFYIKVKEEGKKRGQNYSAYAIHGRSNARTSGGKINAVMRMAKVMNADLYLHAHMHDLIHEIEDIYEVDRGTIRLHRKHYIVTGGYLQYGGYAEEGNYPPSGPSGSARIKFHSDEHRITVKI